MPEEELRRSMIRKQENKLYSCDPAPYEKIAEQRDKLAIRIDKPTEHFTALFKFRHWIRNLEKFGNPRSTKLLNELKGEVEKYPLYDRNAVKQIISSKDSLYMYEIISRCHIDEATAIREREYHRAKLLGFVGDSEVDDLDENREGEENVNGAYKNFRELFRYKQVLAMRLKHYCYNCDFLNSPRQVMSCKMKQPILTFTNCCPHYDRIDRMKLKDVMFDILRKHVKELDFTEYNYPRFSLVLVCDSTVTKFMPAVVYKQFDDSGYLFYPNSSDKVPFLDDNLHKLVKIGEMFSPVLETQFRKRRGIRACNVSGKSFCSHVWAVFNFNPLVRLPG